MDIQEFIRKVKELELAAEDDLARLSYAIRALEITRDIALGKAWERK